MHWFLRMLITSQGEILGRKTARRLKYFLSCKPAKTQLWFATQTKILTFHFHTKASQVTNVTMVAPLGNCTTYNFFCRHCPQASYISYEYTRAVCKDVLMQKKAGCLPVSTQPIWCHRGLSANNSWAVWWSLAVSAWSGLAQDGVSRENHTAPPFAAQTKGPVPARWQLKLPTVWLFTVRKKQEQEFPRCAFNVPRFFW